MNRSAALLLLLTPACATSGLGSPAQAPDTGRRESVPRQGTLVTGMLGVSELEVTDIDLDSSLGDVADTDDVSLPLLGAVFQQPLAGKRLRVGLEAGFSVSWESDSEAVVLDTGTVLRVAENDFLLADVFAGAFADVHLGERLRLYGGAGPLLQYGQINLEWNDSVLGDQSVDESGFGLGYYARTGFELAFGSGMSIGLGVRFVDASFDPGGGIDDVEFQEFQYVLTATRGS